MAFFLEGSDLRRRRGRFRKKIMKITTGEKIWEVKQVLEMRRIGRDEYWGVPGDLGQ